MKDYLSTEQSRNKAHAGIYERMLKIAFGETCAVLVGHHIGFEFNGDINTENEIPSSDTLLFDHDIMQRVFGSKYLSIMANLAVTPVELRDSMLEREFNQRHGYTNPA